MAGQGSSRVTLREIDESQVRSQEQLPQGTPAAIVGTSKKGPAFVPQTFASRQQFEEIFGSLSDVTKDSNANQFGPLAVNEWMKNSEAGTYVRVLGAGDGKAASENSVNSAGFTVGQQLVQPTATNPGKLGDNPFSTSNVQGKSYFLGCLMSDTDNSNLLKDSGVASVNASGSITIQFNAAPLNSGSITLIGINPSDITSESKTIGFLDAAGAIEGTTTNFTFVTTGSNNNDHASNFAADINANYSGLTASSFNNIVTINQIVAGESGNTKVTSNLNGAGLDDIIITGSEAIKNSSSDVTIQFRESQSSDTRGAVHFHFDYNRENTRNDGNIDTTIQVKARNPKTNSADAVSYKVLDKTRFETQMSTDTLSSAEQALALAQGYYYRNASNARVLFDTGITDLKYRRVLAFNNLIRAFNHTESQGYIKITTGSHNLDGLIKAYDKGFNNSSKDSQVLELVLNHPGSEQLGAESKTLPSLTHGSGLDQIRIVNPGWRKYEKSSSTITQATFASGSYTNASVAPSISLSLSGIPSVGENFTLPASIGADNGSVAQKFVFIANNNGSSNGTADSNDIQIELGASIDIVLDNIKDAILKNNGGRLDKDDVDVTINTDSNFITIKSKITESAILHSHNKDVTTNMSSVATFSNPAGESIVGNAGTKTTSFHNGAGFKTKPIIRGMIMTPQGVRPTLETKDDLGSSVSHNVDEDILRSVSVNGASFGTATTDLQGYVLGKVENQSFTLLLNGFNNSEQSAKLVCSFDPRATNYFTNVLNTDPTRIEEYGHYLYANWDVEKEIAVPSNAGIAYTAGSDLQAFCVPGETPSSTIPNYEDFTSRYRTARSPWVVSQAFDGDEKDRTDLTSDSCYKLFKLHALDDGEIGNKQYRVLVSNISLGTRGDYGSFNLSLESLRSDPVSGTRIIEWKNLNLDPDSKNFIGRVIGNHHIYWDFDREESRQRLIETGEFPVKNKFVRVELHPDVMNGEIPISSLPVGFQGPGYVKTAVSGNFTESLGMLPDGFLSEAKVLPLPMVKSISRLAGSDLESSSRLPWGIKFGIKRGLDTEYKELTEQEYNKSLYSWMKFMPDIGSNPAFVEGELSNDTFQNNFFSLEKIHVVTGSSDTISSWDKAEYRRDGSAGSEGHRFVVIEKDAKGTNVPYLKFRFFMQGGFDGVNIFDKEKAKLSNVATLREGLDEAGNNSFSGPTINSYKKAIDTLKDKTTFEMQLLSIPGIRSSQVTDYAIQACEDRFDAMLVMDIEEYDDSDDINLIVSKSDKPSAINTVEKFSDRNLDTSFAAAYFPDVISIKPSDGSSIVVPPSVVMLGAIGLNDRLADPWFAPAGLTRGRLNASDSRLRMPRSVLDQVYDADINPIYVPAGREREVFTFGQKTLLKDQSALDRINVRRLLINLRRRVRKVAEKLLFEPNRASTLERFSQLVEPILAEVQQRRGVDRYKVQIDTNTTTQNDIENNTIRGKIYIQPTKSVEFISLDFVVTNSINE